MTVLVLTIPHSGTHFLNHFLTLVLRLRGTVGVGIPNLEYLSENNKFIQTHATKHLWDEDIIDIKLTDMFDSLIVTLRHPHKSWLTHEFNGGTIEEYIDIWKCFIGEINKFDTVTFVPIDQPKSKRLSVLTKLAKVFDKPVTKQVKAYANEWQPMHKSGRTDRKLTKAETGKLKFAVLEYDKWLM